MDIVLKACQLDGQPLSELPIKNIVDKYIDGTGLAKQIKLDINRQDFQTHFIKSHESYILSDKKINVRVCHNYDPNSKEVYLFIHGLGGTLEQFEPLLRLLDLDKKSFIAIDLPGFGKSDELSDYSMLNVVNIIHQVLQKVLKANNVTLNLVGHSMGCYLSLHFIEIYSKDYRLNHLVLLASPKPRIEQLDKSKWINQYALKIVNKIPWTFDYYRTWLDQSKGLQSSGIERFFYNNDESDQDLRYRKLWQFYNNVQIKSKSIIAYLLGWEAIEWSKVRNILSRGDCITKVTIVYGDQDRVTSVEQANDLREAFPKNIDTNLIIIKNCSHNLCFDAPAEVCSLFYKNILN